jgi:hypothetical protein
MQKYKLYGGDNACYGPIFGPVQAEEECEVAGSEGEHYLLLRLLNYILFQMVGVGRVLPGKVEELYKGMSNKNTEYWSIGFCYPMDTE